MVTFLHRPATAARGGDYISIAWSQALERVAQDGGVLLPDRLGSERLRQLRAQVGECPLRAAQARVGVVRQRAETATLAVEQWSPALRETASWLTRCTQGSGWTPNEASIMAYSGHGAGISPHRDHRRFARLIAVLSISGVARFRVVADREGRHVLHDWKCKPGDVVLLRAPGLADPVDGSDPRPLHTVRARPISRRVSLTFRMDKEIK